MKVRGGACLVGNHGDESWGVLASNEAEAIVVSPSNADRVRLYFLRIQVHCTCWLGDHRET